MRRRAVASTLGLAVLAGGARGETPRRGPEVHGHRGARAVAPENTMAGFRHAFAAGADAVELDVRATADGVLVVHHDATLSRALCARADGGPVPRGLALRSLTAGALAAFRCGGPGEDGPRTEPIPSLAEVLAWLRDEALPARAGFSLDVEVKHEEGRPDHSAPPGELARLVLAELRRGDALRHVRVLSFSPAVLSALHALDPELPLVVLGDGRSDDLVAVARAVGARGVGPRRSLLSKRRVARYREAGLSVLTWTVNDEAGWDEAIGHGVDAIVTDDPAALAAHLSRRGLR